jgi:RsiW-degrading membrane proteinase PrsW (M82 family)
VSSPLGDPVLENAAPSQRAIWAPRWWAVFLIGLALWIATIGAAYLTTNLILLPTIVLIGSFLVPVTAVVWNLDHDPSPELSPRRILGAFIVAGVVGVLGASVLEYYFVSGGVTGFLEVGLIEEFVKGLLILAVAWGIHTYRTKDGMVLGATVGFGFAALESSGYALVSLFVVHGHQLFLSVTSVITTELIRGVLAPFGHGMWSAILGGAIFAAARHGQLRMAWTVLGAFILVAILHGAFDTFSGIIGYLVVSAVGLIPLVWLWRRADAIDVRRRIS